NNNNPRFDSSTNTVKRQIGFNFNPIYVDDDNTTGTEDGSVEYPFNTINEALTFLYQNPAGDNAVRMIYVMEGHYQAGGQIGISPGSVPIYVKGIGNAEDVIIGDSVNINSSSTDNVTFENVTFDRNYQWPTLTMRYGNIIGCVFRHNFVGAVARSGYFDRNIFYENQSAVKLMGAGYLTNNTIVDNDASFYALLGPFEWGSGLSSALLRNNIIWGNGLAQNTEYMKVQGDYNVSDDSFILGLGATNFSADPLFEDRVNADYHIIQQSPAVDAGNPDAAYNDPDGSRNDIGAFYLGHVEPAIEILAPVEGESVSQRRVTVSGWAMFNFGANIKINGVPAVTTSIGNSLYNFSAENVPLHYINSTTGQLTARLADSVLVIDVKEVNYDWPLIEILSPQDQDVVGNSIVVSGFAVGPLPSSVAVNGVNASVAPTGSIDEYAFNAPIDLNFINGSAAIQVISRQGNDILETLTITVFEEQEQESVPPTASASAEPNPAMEGQSVTLTGAGSDPDGGSVSYHWTVPQGITVNNPDIARITFDVPQVSVDQVYNFILTVTDDENQTATADLSLVVENNLLAPSVEITADSNPVSEGAMVTVYAAVNDDGNIVSYDWQASEGIVLQVVDDLTVTFVAPQVDQDANYTISLTVTDNDNLTATDSVRVTVKDIPESNRPPVAQFTATPNPLDENTRSLLDASASTDPDGTIARYEWSASGGTIVVEPMDRNKAHFIAPSVTKSTDYMITLKVIDDAGLTDSKSITITVKDVPVPNLPPVAQFTVNPNPINEKEFGLLDASLSSDPDGAIARYEWTASKGMTITGQRNASANFMAPEVDQDTDYVITLKVIDSEGLTAEASMTVTVKNVVVFVPQPPVAVISAPSLIDEGQMIILDGSSSFDPDGNIVSYTWVSKEGLPVIRDPLMPAVVQVIAPKVSENTGFTFTLKVVDNDGLGFSANAVVVIRHVDEIDFVHEMNNAPVADNLSLLTQKNMALNITLTASDPDDDLLTFAVISQPAHGVVSGVAPNLIYMPSSNYVGADSFTFKANDGILDSNIAVVSIAVNDSIGSMPVDVDLPESGGGDNSVPILGQDNQNSSGDLGIYFGGNNTSFLNPKDETSQMKKRSSSLLIKKYSPIDSSLRIEEGQSISFSIDPNDRDQIEKLLSDAIKAEKDKFKIDRRLVFQWFLDGNLVEGADGSSWTYISSMGDIGEHSIFVEASYGAIYTDRSLSWDVQVISSDRSGPLVLGARADDYGSFVRIQALIDDSLTGGSQVANASLELTAGNRIIKLGSIKPVDTKFDRVKEYVSYDYILPEKKFKTLAFRLTAKDVLGNETSYPLNVDLPPEQNQKENTQANNQPEKPTKEKSKH
ncbi:MAG: PKD domain-containing protein, partial [Candidatus Omnitrophota bacterium]